MNEKQPSGQLHTFWLPSQLDEKAEQARSQLGLGKSAFYRFAVTELVKQFAQAAKEAPD